MRINANSSCFVKRGCCDRRCTQHAVLVLVNLQGTDLSLNRLSDMITQEIILFSLIIECHEAKLPVIISTVFWLQWYAWCWATAYLIPHLMDLNPNEVDASEWIAGRVGFPGGRVGFPGQENHECDISTQKTHECRFLFITWH
jgi:hypothetical protein